MNIFRTFWKSVRELFEDLFILALVNGLWWIINLPFAIALFFLGGTNLVLFFILLLASVLTFGPTNAGLYTIAERVTEGRTSSWRHFFEGMREYAVLSWKVYGLWMLGLIIILFNLQFYNMNGSTIGALISIVFLYLALVWFGLLIYIGPLMRIQSDKRVRTIARNAALMTFGRPVFSLVTLVMMALIVLVSIWLPFLLLIATFAFLALWSFRATLTLIAEAEARRTAAAEKSASNQVAGKGRGGQVRPRD